jgi:hypothetical protein
MVESGGDQPVLPEDEQGLSRRELLIRVGVYGPPVILAGGALLRSGVAFAADSESSGGGGGEGGSEEGGGGGGGGSEEGGGGGGGEEGGGGGITFTGFFPPVDNPPVSNVVNAGRAIPVKFSLGGDHGLDIFAAGYPQSQQVSCTDGSPLDTVEETVTAGSSSLSYDPTVDQYTYVWKTASAWAGTCRKLVVRLSDDTDHIAYFKFK